MTNSQYKNILKGREGVCVCVMCMQRDRKRERENEKAKGKHVNNW